MLETKEDVYQGLWFLPGTDIKIQGRLTVSDNFIDLHLTDPEYYSFIKTDSLDEQHYPVIYGISNHRELISLYDCSGFSGDFSVKYVLYGDEHFSNIENLKFNVVSISLPLFDKWIIQKSFNKEIKKGGFSINYIEPASLEFDLTAEIKLTVDFHCYIPNTDNKTKIILNEYSSIQLISTSENGLLLTDFIKQIVYLQQLLSFLFREGANIDYIRVYSSLTNYKNNRQMGIMLFGLFPFNKYAHPDLALHPLIKYDLIKEEIGSIVSNWFNFANAGQHIINLILQDYFYRGSFDENRFLNLIRVLEIYHTFKFPGTKLPPADFKKKIADIIANVPDAYKNEVKECLNFSNEFTLDMRLQALVKELNGIQLGYDYKFDEDFIKKVKWSRNYYTHYNPALKNKASTGEALMKLTELCRTLINFLILKHLGVTDDKLIETFKFYFENSYYSNYFL